MSAVNPAVLNSVDDSGLDGRIAVTEQTRGVFPEKIDICVAIDVPNCAAGTACYDKREWLKEQNRTGVAARQKLTRPFDCLVACRVTSRETAFGFQQSTLNAEVLSQNCTHAMALSAVFSIL